MDDSNQVSFKWGIKRGKGGVRKEVQFYGSFTYDGVEYLLYDSVYVYVDDESEPYVGKLIKIWELRNTKKVKVLWFFRSSEISKFIGDLNILENELFLACGEGVGVANINLLEAISGKCNVVCISKDGRNRQPTDMELKNADFIFYRTFDVDQNTISDKLGETIAGVEVEYLLNKNEPQTYCSLKTEFEHKGNCENVASSAGKELASQKHPTARTVVPDLLQGFLAEKDAQTAEVSANIGQQAPVATVDGESPFPTAGLQLGEDKEGKNSAADVGEPARKALQIAMHVNTVNSPDRIRKNNIHGHGVDVKIDEPREMSVVSLTADEKRKLDLGKHSTLSADAVGKVGYVNGPEAVNGRPSKKLKADGPTSSNVKEVSPAIVLPDESKLDIAKDSQKSSELTGKRKCADDTSHLNARADSTVRSGDGHCSGTLNLPAAADVQKVKASQSAADTDVDKLKDPLAKIFPGVDLGSSKPLKDNAADVHKVKASQSVADTDVDKLKDPLTKISRGVDLGSSKPLKDNDNKTTFSINKLKKASLNQTSEKGAKVYGQVVEVTRRPHVETSKWFTGLPWEERVRDANRQGILVLLQNLDPTYSSSEVEDIVWHGFKENCTANVIPCTTEALPPFGQAFVIMKTKDAARRVVQELQQGCLMLPNGRPLVGRTGILRIPGKQILFPGHISIDRLKLHMQRERLQREAVSTSHSAQPSTLEYDMAMEWRLLQQRLAFVYKKFFELQRDELEEVKAKLKPKPTRVA